MDFKISFFCVATEPLKNRYPIKESIHSILPLADEVIVIFGRREEETEKYLLNLNKKIKLINTDKWNIDWSYDIMTYHFDFALKQCSGDICIKFDIDHIYRQTDINFINEFRNGLFSMINKYHIFYIPKYNYLPNNKFLMFENGTYCINSYLLKKEGKKFNIGREKYVNTIIIEGDKKIYVIKDERYGFVNYDCTFMTKELFIEKQYRWYMAYYKLFGDLERFNITFDILNDHEKILKFVTDRVFNRIKWAKKKNVFYEFKYNYNPNIIREKIGNLNENHYGYNYFQREDILKLLA
tara:strand:- start:162 stop:1049 length:888 start_codon:yes stop_codon:yes gene_type:complete